MGFKIRSSINNPYARKKHRAATKNQAQEPEVVTIGEGDFAVVTMSLHGGPTVVQHFKTEAEAMAQHQRNVAEDKPLVGFKGGD